MGFGYAKAFSILQGTPNHLQLPPHVKIAIKNNPTNIDNTLRVGWELGIFYCFVPLGNDNMVKQGIAWTDDINRFLKSTMKRWKTWMEDGFLFFAWRVVCPSLLENDAKVWLVNESERVIAETTELFSVSHGNGVASVPVCDLLDLIVDQMTNHAINGTGFEGRAGFGRNTLIKLKEFENIWKTINNTAESFLPSGIEYDNIRMADDKCVFVGLKGGGVSDYLARTLRMDQIKCTFIDSLRQSVLKEGSWNMGAEVWKQEYIDNLGNSQSEDAIGEHATVFEAPMVLERFLIDPESFRFRDHGSSGSGGGGSGGGGSGGGGGNFGFDMGGNADERMSFSTSGSATSQSTTSTIHSTPRNNIKPRKKRKSKTPDTSAPKQWGNDKSFDQLAADISDDALEDAFYNYWTADPAPVNQITPKRFDGLNNAATPFSQERSVHKQQLTAKKKQRLTFAPKKRPLTNGCQSMSKKRPLTNGCQSMSKVQRSHHIRKELVSLATSTGTKSNRSRKALVHHIRKELVSLATSTGTESNRSRKALVHAVATSTAFTRAAATSTKSFSNISGFLDCCLERRIVGGMPMRQPPVNLAPRQRFPTKQISTKSRTTSTHEVHDVIDVDAAELERPEAVKSITAEVKLESTPEPDYLIKAREVLDRAMARAAAEAAESSIVPEPVTSAFPEPVSSGGVSSATTGGVVDLTLDSDDE